MAYRELGVIELREVWRRYSAGEGVRAIARGTGIDRKTITKYVAAAVALGLRRGAPPPTEDQLAAFGRGVRGTPVGRPAALAKRLTSQTGADRGVADRRPASDQDPPPAPRARRQRPV